MTNEPLDQRLDHFEGEWGCQCHILMEEAANRIRELETEVNELKFPQKWATETSLPEPWPVTLDRAIEGKSWPFAITDDLPYKPPTPAALEQMRKFRDDAIAATEADEMPSAIRAQLGITKWVPRTEPDHDNTQPDPPPTH